MSTAVGRARGARCACFLKDEVTKDVIVVGAQKGRDRTRKDTKAVFVDRKRDVLVRGGKAVSVIGGRRSALSVSGEGTCSCS
jgi:hypothetical protein